MSTAVVKGTAPHNLISQVLRTNIYSSPIYKRMHSVNEASILDTIADELKSVGGIQGAYGTPSVFLCLLTKLLHLNVTMEIVLEYLHQKDFKYLTILAAMYIRMVCPPRDVWKHLEPYLDDYRKIIVGKKSGGFVVANVDTIVYDFLHEDTVFDVHLPRIPKGRVEMEKAFPKF